VRLHRVANIVLVLALTPVAAFSIWTRWPGTEGWDAWWSTCEMHDDWQFIIGSDAYVEGNDSGGRLFCHPGTPLCYGLVAPNWRTAYLKARYYSTRPGPYGPSNPMLCEKADGWFYNGSCCNWNSGPVTVYGMTIWDP